MSSTWFIDLKRKVSRREFDRVCSEVGIDFSSATVGGNTYYDTRHEAETAAQFGIEQNPVSKLFGIGGVEIDFGGIRQTGENNAYATQITLQSILEKDRYKSMKRTASDLAQKLPFKNISGEWFDVVSRKPLPYSPDVYQMLERK